MRKTSDLSGAAGFPGVTRRHSFILAGAALAGASLALGLRPARAEMAPADALAALERANGGRLGVTILNTGTGQSVGHRADERFAMCSTFKFLVASLILLRVDAGEEQLYRRIVISKSDIIDHSPITEKHVGGEGMSVAELCAATMTVSDNGAANVLLASFEGPPAVTAFARSLGDGVTRLDRMEPELNTGGPGDERDTTSPSAMAGLMRQILLGDALTAASRDILIGWLRGATTGKTRLRAGLPAGWTAGDKTGTGGDGPTNDIAIIWPPDGPALIVTAYYERTGHKMDENAVILAEVGKVAASTIA